MRQHPLRPLRHLIVALCVVVAAALCGQPAVPAFAEAGKIDAATQKLFDAIHANDFAAAQASVDAGADVDVPGRWGMTAIELAIDKGYFKIAHYLVAVRNFENEANESKSNRVATPSAPGHDIQDQPPPSGASAARPAVPNAGAVAASPVDTGPARPVGTVADQPFYAPLEELETTAGREAEADGPRWPAGKPNPFDPGTPAVGSNLKIIGEVGATDPGIALRPAGDLDQPTLEAQTPMSVDTTSPRSAADAPQTSPAASGKTKPGSGLGGGIIGETGNFK
jgi:hypothetical protein